MLILRAMPTLDWIGKSAVVNHHKAVPYRLVKCEKDLSAGEAGEGNLLVEGDNLHALKALLPYYGGKVKCIYIDPPYNTGNEGWIYNDNVNAPEIKRWLGQVVGKEAEDLSRHDKWLCMMYPRLRLLWDFLAEDGVMFISINDVEGSALETIAKEIFGPRNFLTRLIWNTEGNTDNQLEVKINHEYVLMLLKDMRFKDVAVGSVVDPNTREDSNLWKGIADNNINKNNPANPPDIFTIPVGFPVAEKELFYPAKQVDDDFFKITRSEGWLSKQVKAKYKIENLVVVQFGKTRLETQKRILSEKILFCCSGVISPRNRARLAVTSSHTSNSTATCSTHLLIILSGSAPKPFNDC